MFENDEGTVNKINPDLVALGRLLCYAHDEALRLGADEAAFCLEQSIADIHTRLEKHAGLTPVRTSPVQKYLRQ
jgi:hypothetical protein